MILTGLRCLGLVVSLASMPAIPYDNVGAYFYLGMIVDR
jgi:hypothetical protein